MTPVNKTATILNTKVRGYVMIGDTKLPLTSIAASFALNSIPTAQIVIPIGSPVNSDTETKTLRIKDLAKEFRRYRQIDVWLQLEGKFEADTDWPTEPFKVFSGYVTASSTKRTAGGIGLVVQATHWLIDLDSSSAFSESLVPGSPVTAFLPYNLAYDTLAGFVNDPAMKDIDKDIWQGGIKAKFIQLCNESFSGTSIECIKGFGAGKVKNDLALKRFNGTENAFDIPKKVEVGKLKIIDDAKAATVTLNDIVKQTIGSYMSNGAASVGNTYWDRLKQLGGLLGFAIVPTVESATCAPIAFCPVGNGGNTHKIIEANDCFSISVGESLFRMWRGMVIVSEWQTNYATLDLNPQAQDDSKAFVGSAGCYFPSEDLRLDADIRDLASKGVIQFAPAPPYASQAYYSLLIEALRVKDILDKPNNTMQTASTVNNKNLQPSYGQAYATASSIGKKYAEWLYWMNQYKGNTANVTGKLRFDIGPGSFVSLEDLDGKLYDSPAQYSYLYGTVTAVEFFVDTSTATASTMFSLSHIRREHERENGSEKHPMYTDVWRGTVLQDIGI